MVTEVRTKRIDADTHFSLTIDHRDLRDLIPRAGSAELQEMVYRDALQIVDLDVVRAAIAGGEPSLDGQAGNPTWDPEARLAEMDRLGFEMQVLNTQRAMPNLLMPPGQPLVASLGARPALQQRGGRTAEPLSGALHLPDHRALGRHRRVDQGARTRRWTGAARGQHLRQLPGPEPGRLRAVSVLGGRERTGHGVHGAQLHPGAPGKLLRPPHLLPDGRHGALPPYAHRYVRRVRPRLHHRLRCPDFGRRSRPVSRSSVSSSSRLGRRGWRTRCTAPTGRSTSSAPAPGRTPDRASSSSSTA